MKRLAEASTKGDRTHRTVAMPRPRTRGDHKAAGSVGSQDAVEQAGEGARKDELQILEKGGCQSEEEKNRKDQKLPAEAEPADGRIDKNIAAIAPEGGGGLRSC